MLKYEDVLNDKEIISLINSIDSNKYMLNCRGIYYYEEMENY